MEILVPEDIEIKADIHMFETVIRNLVSNSVKFTPSGGKVNVEVEGIMKILLKLKSVIQE